MSKFEQRESKRKSVVEDIVGSNKEEKKEVLARTFYINPEHVKALAFEKAGTGKDLSEIIREALDDYFGDKLEEYM